MRLSEFRCLLELDLSVPSEEVAKNYEPNSLPRPMRR